MDKALRGLRRGEQILYGRVHLWAGPEDGAGESLTLCPKVWPSSVPLFAWRLWFTPHSLTMWFRLGLWAACISGPGDWDQPSEQSIHLSTKSCLHYGAPRGALRPRWVSPIGNIPCVWLNVGTRKVALQTPWEEDNQSSAFGACPDSALRSSSLGWF